MQGLAALVRNTCEGIVSAVRLFELARSCLEELAKQPGTTGHIAPGFDAKVNDYLLASVPPRATQVGCKTTMFDGHISQRPSGQRHHVSISGTGPTQVTERAMQAF